MSIQEKLAEVVNVLSDLQAHYGDLPEWLCTKITTSLQTVTELQEELKPKAVDVEKCYEAYKNECNFPTSINGIREVIAEIERQKL